MFRHNNKRGFFMKKKILVILTIFAFFLPIGNYVCHAEEQKSLEGVSVCLSINNRQYTYFENENSYIGDNFEINYKKYLRNKKINSMGKANIISNMLASQKSEKEIVTYLLPKFDEFLTKIKKENEIAPINAVASFTNSSKEVFSYQKDKEGYVIDETSLFAELLDKLSLNLININCKLNLVKKEAEVSLYDVKQKTKLRSSESTSFASSEEGRRHNLLKSISCFNGLVVRPGEEVSFNKITGDKSYEAGYKDAKVILNGEFVMGVGGGVCQASTTIYNAALMAGLEIVEVHRHSLPVYYVPAGFDAMVSEASDMIFKNNTDSNIYFRTYAKNERVYAEVYGESMKGVSYKRVSTKVRDIETKEDIIKQDSEGKYADKITYKGEYYRVRFPRLGFEVNAYLQKYLNGNLVCEKLIRNEIYAAQKGVVYEGTKENTEGIELRDYGAF